MSEWRGWAATRGNSRIAILATPDEAASIQEVLAREGGDHILIDPQALVSGIKTGELAAAILSSELIPSLDMDALAQAIDDQPPWSDFPFVLILDRGGLADLSETLEEFGHVAIVERPLNPPILSNAVRAALRSRARQREAEAYLLQREVAEEHLRRVTVTLEMRVRERTSDLKAAHDRLVREAEERRAAEESLRESEELYRYTVELSQQVAWTADPNGTMSTISARFSEITGLNKAVSTHEDWLSVLHPDDVAPVLREWQNAIAQRERCILDFRMRVADGSYRRFRARAAPRFDESGMIIRWYGFTEDIEEQKRAEERLRESEELHRYTIELSQQIAWKASSDGRILSISPRLFELTGLQAGNLVRDAMHPQDRDRVLRSWKEAVDRGVAHNAEFRLRMADGTYRQFRARAAPLRDGEGLVVRWYGTHEDIHEQKKAELALKQAEERYRLAARATNDAIWDRDLTTGLMHWSDSATQVFGYSNDKPRPHSWWETRLHPEDGRRVLESLAKAIKGKEDRWSAGYKYLVADGSYADVFDRGFIIRDEKGKAVRAVGAMTDVTERNRAEAEIRRMQTELIHVSRLSAMGAMASTLAHELNQPLTAVTSFIRGSRRLLEQQDPSALAKACDALQSAEAGALRAGQIVRRLRELVSRGNVSVRPEELSKLIEEACVLAFVDEQLLSVKHAVSIDPDAEWVDADRIQIQQVLINLIRNGIQAMQGQPVREILISTEAISEGMAQVSVADTGTGLLAEVREALFSPFHTSKPEGMGIGLSISRTIVEAHGGKIWAEDRECGGTIFRFTLPRSVQVSGPDAFAEAEEPR